MAWSMAWLIHHVAYVENLKPLRQSNFSTACIRPMLPSWIMSSSAVPGRVPRRVAILATSLRFARMNRSRASAASCTAVLSPGAVPALGQTLPRLGSHLDDLRQAALVLHAQKRLRPGLGQVRGDRAVRLRFVPAG